MQELRREESTVRRSVRRLRRVVHPPCNVHARTIYSTSAQGAISAVQGAISAVQEAIYHLRRAGPFIGINHSRYVWLW